jgi:hypothetical protein
MREGWQLCIILPLLLLSFSLVCFVPWVRYGIDFTDNSEPRLIQRRRLIIVDEGELYQGFCLFTELIENRRRNLILKTQS